MVSARDEKRSRSTDGGKKSRSKKSKHHEKSKLDRKRKKEDPKPSDADATPPPEVSGGNEISLSIDDTNKLREKLGLAPLEQQSGPQIRETESGDKVIREENSTLEFVHAVPENWADRKKTEVLKEKLSTQKDKRRRMMILEAEKGLAEEGETDTAQEWVERMRKQEGEKHMADKRAQMFEQIDEELGVAGLIEEEIIKKRKKPKQKKQGTGSDLGGLSIQHSKEDFLEGENTVLVLKDKDVLDEGDETLINPTILEQNKWKKNAELRRKKPGYTPYEEEVDEFGNFKEKILLGKYNEELEGEKVESFKLDSSGSVDISKEKLLADIKAKLRNKGKLTLEQPKFQVASEYYTPEEMATFRKPKKKKIKKLRKRDTLKPDDLISTETAVVGDEDYGSRSRGKGRKKAEYEEPEEKDPPTEGEDKQWIRIETDQLEDLSDSEGEEEADELAGIIVEDDAEDELQGVLDKARRLRQKEHIETHNANRVASLVQSLPVAPQSPVDSSMCEGSSPPIVLDAVSEYCRGLGDIPTYGLAGNRTDAIDLSELKEETKEKIEEPVEPKEEKKHKSSRRKHERHKDLPEDQFDALMREHEQSKGKWIEADDKRKSREESHQSDDSSSDDEEGGNILGDEVDASKGIAGALKMAMQKGYLELEKDRKPEGASMKHLESQRCSVVDKQFNDMDDKYAKKLEWMGARGGPARPFEEKTSYKPEFSLSYKDEHGREMDIKEAFRFQSWKFHGKMPGKRKIEKRAQKIKEKDLMKQMNSTDTPLGTLDKQLNKQKQLQAPYIVLSGSAASKDMGHLSEDGFYDLVGDEQFSVQQVTKLALDTDLKDLGAPSLDFNLDRAAGHLKGPIVLQISKIRNVMQPKIHEYSGGQSNRLLRITFTDGHSSCSALEKDTLQAISMSTTPGTKVCITGTVPLDHGFLLVTQNNCKVLGGKVQKLVEKWQINKDTYSKARHTLLRGDQGPPPWVPFGSRVKNGPTVDTNKNFNSMAAAQGENKSEQEPDEQNLQFDQTRKEKITGIQSGDVIHKFRDTHAPVPIPSAANPRPEPEEKKAKPKPKQPTRDMTDWIDPNQEEKRSTAPATLFQFMQDKIPEKAPNNLANRPMNAPANQASGRGGDYGSRGRDSAPRPPANQRQGRGARDFNQDQRDYGRYQPTNQRPDSRDYGRYQPTNQQPGRSAQGSRDYGQRQAANQHQGRAQGPRDYGQRQPANQYRGGQAVNQSQTPHYYEANQFPALSSPAPPTAAMSNMQISAPRMQSGWMAGQRCLAPWLDGKFYMAQVQSIIGDGNCVVNYLDYNQTDVVPLGVLLHSQY